MGGRLKSVHIVGRRLASSSKALCPGEEPYSRKCMRRSKGIGRNQNLPKGKHFPGSPFYELTLLIQKACYLCGRRRERYVDSLLV